MGRKILFIAPKFYDYHNIIIEKLKLNVSKEVDFFPDRKINLLYGVLNFLNNKFIKLYQFIYYITIYIRIKKKNYSYLFVIKGQDMPVYFVKKVKEINPGIKMIMYQWDSMEYSPYDKLIPYFDNVYTFDFRDHKNYTNVKFLHLFYTEEFKGLRNSNIKPTYDFFFISSFTDERYDFLKRFLVFCRNNNYRLKYYFYIPFSSYFKLVYLKRQKLDKNLLSFDPLPRNEYVNLLKESDIIVDYNHSDQTGLAMRIIEAFGAGKKILTTNPLVSQDPLFSDNWIVVLDEKRIKYPSFNVAHGTERKDNNLFIDDWIKYMFLNENIN